MSDFPEQCVHCGSAQLFTRRVNAGAFEGINLLDGLGGFMRFAKFHVILCVDCGRCEFFADAEARQKASASWQRLGDADPPGTVNVEA